MWEFRRVVWGDELVVRMMEMLVRSASRDEACFVDFVGMSRCRDGDVPVDIACTFGTGGQWVP